MDDNMIKLTNAKTNESKIKIEEIKSITFDEGKIIINKIIELKEDEI